MKYDVIIVGAGSAGAVLAARLSEEPERSVLLLEAGPDYPQFDHLPDELKFGFDIGTGAPSVRTPAGHPISLLTSPHNWQFVARATATAPPMPVPRGKVTGGSSAINTAAFYRGIPEDFAHWAASGNDLWSFEEVLPYFRKIETDVDFQDDDHGTEGPIFVHHACRAAGFPDCPDHNRPGATEVGPSISNNHNSVRFSTALGYLEQSRHRLNLTIRPNCLVQRILFEGKRAVGVVLKAMLGPRLEPTAADLASDAALDAWLLHQVTTYSHISGTCKMGPGSDAMAVVDQYGKVHGLEGLRIGDASIMPNLVRAPINPTVIMMGERIAALVCQGK